MIFSEEDKYGFGLEIVAGMKASAYGISLDHGRDLALENTEPITEEDHKHLDWFKKNKAILREQALFIADIAIKAYKTMGGA